MAIKTRIKTLALSVLIASLAQPASAAFTDSITIGNPKALALGHAITADPPDIDSIHFNPAGLAKYKGRRMYLKAILGLFSTEMELGGHGEYMENLIDRYGELHQEFIDENGNLTYNRSPYEEYSRNDLLFTKSKSEGGPTVMLPGGMVDLPIGAGAAGGASYSPPGSRYTIGTNVYAPLMNGYHVAEDDPGRFAQERATFTLITFFSPTIAVQLTDTFSAGFSVNFNYSGMGLELPIREPHEAIFFLGSPFIQGTFCNPDGTAKSAAESDLPVRVDVCSTEVPPFTQFGKLTFEVDQNIVLGYNMGFLWEPQPWLSLGLSYNSSIKVDMDGYFKFPIHDPFKTFLYNFHGSDILATVGSVLENLDLKLPSAEEVITDAQGPLNVSYEIPQRWNAGLSLQVTPKLKWNFDVRWTEWSTFATIDLKFGQDVSLLKWGTIADMVGTGGSNGISPNSVNYKIALRDVTYWGTGIEYRWNDQLVLRAGYEDRPSAVPEESPNAFIPMSDGKLMSVGFGLDLKGDRHIDFAVAHMKTEKFHPACTAQLGNGCNIANVVYPSYAGQDITSKLEFLIFELGYHRSF